MSAQGVHGGGGVGVGYGYYRYYRYYGGDGRNVEMLDWSVDLGLRPDAVDAPGADADVPVNTLGFAVVVGALDHAAPSRDRPLFLDFLSVLEKEMEKKGKETRPHFFWITFENVT